MRYDKVQDELPALLIGDRYRVGHDRPQPRCE